MKKLKGPKMTVELQRLVDEMKEEGIGKKYDALIGVSGGCDSSYLMHLMKKNTV